MKSFKVSLLLLVFASVALVLWVSYFFDFEQHDYSFILENCACGKIVRNHGGHNLSAQDKAFKKHSADISGRNLPEGRCLTGVFTIKENIGSVLTGKGRPFANKSPPRQS